VSPSVRTADADASWPREDGGWASPGRRASIGNGIAIPVALTTAVVSGYAIPGLPYDASTGVLAAGFLAAGGVLVAAVGGAASRYMTRTYWWCVIVTLAVVVLSTWYASGHGPQEPWWTIHRDGFGGDDQNVFVNRVLPYVGALGALDLDGRVTNAPLFWAVNVWIQRATVALQGRPCVVPSVALNVAFGGLTAALSVGTAFFLAPEGARARSALWARRFVLTCPWLVASSAIFIRDVWIYFACSIALFAGARLRSASVLARVAAFALLGPPLTYAIRYLRGEMMLPFVALLAMAAFAPYLARWTVLGSVAVLAIALGVIGARSSVDGVTALATDRAVRYQEKYLSRAGSGTRTKGTVSGIVSGSLAVRGTVQTAWLPVAPLPKVEAPGGSTYAAAMQAMPFWTVACLVVLWRCARTAGIQSLGPAAVLAWCGALLVAVGFTSGESRHFFAAIPGIVMAVGLGLGGMEDAGARRIARRAVRVTGYVAFASFVFTLVFFGPRVLFG
jgi:hypothetical protein